MKKYMMVFSTEEKGGVHPEQALAEKLGMSKGEAVVVALNLAWELLMEDNQNFYLPKMTPDDFKVSLDVEKVKKLVDTTFYAGK